MRDGWQTRTIESLCARVTSGGTPRRQRDGYYCPPGTGTPWAKTKELDDTWLDDTEEWVTPLGIAESSAKLLPAHTVLMAMYGATVGKLGILRKPMTCNQASCAMIVDPDEGDFRFLFYRLLNDRNGLVGLANGAAQQNLSGTVIKNYLFGCPPLDEQRRIAGVLGALDDLIDTNQRLVSSCVATASALFDQTMYRAAGSEGTSTVPFADSVQIVSGGTPKTSVAEYWDGEIPWYSVVDAPGEEAVWVRDTARKVTAEGIANSATRVLPERTVILSARGTVGKLAFTAVPMAMNQSCYGLRSATGHKGYFTYFSARSLVKILQQHAHGSVFDTITRDSLYNIEVVLPDASTISEFETSIGPLMESARALQEENRQLRATRDELLPLLMSGAVSPSDAAVAS